MSTRRVETGVVDSKKTPSSLQVVFHRDALLELPERPNDLVIYVELEQRHEMMGRRGRVERCRDLKN